MAVSVATIATAALLAAQVARLTIATKVAQTSPELTERLAPQSPVALAQRSMRSVGEAAARGGDVPEQTLGQLRQLAGAAPLRLEPFEVEGAIAERDGDLKRAERLLKTARKRDPRSIATRYLLADVLMRKGDVVPALREIAVLTRLLPGATIQLIPALSAYALTPGAEAKLASILAENPQLKEPLLTALAADPANADRVLAIAGPSVVAPATGARPWQSRLLRNHLDRGDYAGAYSLWRKFAGLPPTQSAPLIFNPDFRQLAAPPPFNWDSASSPAGVAEVRNGTLSVVYYARQDARLVSQLLLLAPGGYRLDYSVGGQLAYPALSWSISCMGAGEPLSQSTLGSGRGTMSFVVPSSGCAAQRLELLGHKLDSPMDSNVQVSPLRLVRLSR
jgi:hypothetical protein